MHESRCTHFHGLKVKWSSLSLITGLYWQRKASTSSKSNYLWKSPKHTSVSLKVRGSRMCKGTEIQTGKENEQHVGSMVDVRQYKLLVAVHRSHTSHWPLWQFPTSSTYRLHSLRQISHLSVCLDFLICKIKVLIVPTLENCCED